MTTPPLPRTNSNQLSEQELARYSRQLNLPEFGIAGQLRLKNSRVLIIGAGGLGSPLALYLARAGVGTLGVVEADRVDISNLHRQILYREADVGRTKLEAAARELRSVNSQLNLELHDERFTEKNAHQLVGLYDCVVDASDNFRTRYLANDSCVIESKPLVYGSVAQFQGLISVVRPGVGPCYRCLHPHAPPPELAPSCNVGGVLGVLPGTIALLQATEVIKLLTGLGELLCGRVLFFDALKMRFREIELARDPSCAICGDSPHIFTASSESATLANCFSPTPSAQDLRQIDSRELRRRGLEWAQIVDVRENFERAITSIKPSLHIPLAELPTRLAQLDKISPIVVYCRSGQRSAKACELLRANGFREVYNLTGGIDAYIALDKTM